MHRRCLLKSLPFGRGVEVDLGSAELVARQRTGPVRRLTGTRSGHESALELTDA